MIWVIGCKGMLGTELTQALSSRGLHYVATDRDCDITDPAALQAFAQDKTINVIINCSAYTAVDKAEEDRTVAQKINVDGVRHIGSVAKKLGAKVIHLSTDYVFDGTKNTPYLESDQPAPASYYGQTKWEGELALAQEVKEHFIVRTAWLYGQHGPNFVTTMLRLMAEKESLNVVADQRGSPTWARDLVEALITIAESQSKEYGIYHYSNEGDISWYDFAVKIQNLGWENGVLAKKIPVTPITTDKYPTKAKRPAFSLLSKEKIKTEFGVIVPRWEDSLTRYFKLAK